MIKILKESFQDVSNYLTSSSLKEKLSQEFPDYRTDPQKDEEEVLKKIVDLAQEEYPDEGTLLIEDVTVLQVMGDEVEVLSASHPVIQYNGTWYDFTAHQFSESFNRLLDYSKVPIIQSVITNDGQIADGVSSVKYYALLGGK